MADETPTVRVDLWHPASTCPNSGKATTQTLEVQADGWTIARPDVLCVLCLCEPMWSLSQHG